MAFLDPMDHRILSFILTGKHDLSPDKSAMSSILQVPWIHETHRAHPEQEYIAGEDDREVEDIQEDIESSIEANKVVQMWRTSALFRRQEDVTKDFAEESRPYLDPELIPSLVDVGRMSDLLHTYPYYAGGLGWEGRDAVDWGSHKEMLDEGFLLHLSDMAEPWPGYEWPVCFARD